MAKSLGRHIVADSKVCHGKPTFRGTRIFVGGSSRETLSAAYDVTERSAEIT